MTQPETPAVPVDQAALRDRIADKLADVEGWQWAPGYDKTASPTYRHFLRQADAVLAVLPAPVDRAAVLLEAADVAESLRQFERCTGPRRAAQTSENVGILRVADELRRLAAGAHTDTQDDGAAWLAAAAECNRAGGAYAERGADAAAGAAFALMETFVRKAGDAEYVATPCSGPVPCEDGGEPCDVHERLMGHIEGDHELCAPDCGAAWQRAQDAVSSSPVSAAPRHDEEARCFVVEPHAAHDWLPFPGSGLVAKGVVRCPGYTLEAGRG